ncbi:archaeosortase/exosortase family protein [Chloroflexota bacterium]
MNRTVIKTGLWLLLSLALSILLFRDFWVELPVILSPQWIFGEYHVAPWGILALCLAFLWLKRKEVWEEMRRSGSSYKRGIIAGVVLIGLALIAIAVLIPVSRNYLVFKVLLASLALFGIFFFRAIKIPVVLFTIYGFVITFPLLIQRFAEYAYSQTALIPMMGIMNLLGYQIQTQGRVLSFTSISGETVSAAITTACAGPATMAVFIALFVLMMMDRPLPGKKAAWLFIIGVAGTWIQSIIRLVLLMVMGYYWGNDALWTAHYWTIYMLFPLWYLIYVYIYFHQINKSLESTGQQDLGSDMISATQGQDNGTE